MPAVELPSRRILWNADGILAVDKPAGLVAHATVDRGRDHLVAAVERYLVATEGDAGHLHLLHRLDVGTSGVVLLSRRPDLDGPLSLAFGERRVDKRYLAIVRRGSGSVFGAGPVERRDYLAAGKGAGGRTEVVRAGGKPAHTTFTRVAETAELLLLEARPHTGRTHQIRVHLAALGHPIVGDALYGGAEPNAKRMMLHAASLGLVHPRSEQVVRIVAAPPRAFRNRFEMLRTTDDPTGGRS